MVNVFDNRTTEAIVQIVRQHWRRIQPRSGMETQGEYRAAAAHYPAVVTATVTGAQGDTPGSGQVTVKRLDTQSGDLVDLFTDQDALQLGKSVLPVGTKVIVHFDPWGDIWIDSPSTPSMDGGGRIRFRSTFAMSNREMAAVVVEVLGNPVNQATQEPYEVGDNIVVSDIHNEWPEAVENASGIAFLWPERVDNPGTGTDESRPSFWQIERCTLPITRVKAYLNDCLKASDNSGVGWVKTNDQLQLIPETSQDPWKLSTGSEVDIPPEWVLVDDENYHAYQITFENPLGLHAVHQSVPVGSGSTALRKFVILERVAGFRETDPLNETLPQYGGNDTAVWQVVDVEAPHAETVKGTIIGDDATTAVITKWQNGERSPESCKPTFEWGCDPPCDNQENSCFTAQYIKETHEYWIISTDSAVMGKPRQKDFYIKGEEDDTEFDKCELKISHLKTWGWWCEEEEVLQTIAMDLVEQKVAVPEFFDKVDEYTGDVSKCLPLRTIKVCSSEDNDEDTCFPFGECEDFDSE